MSLIIESLSSAYGSKRVLHDINIQAIKPGSFVALIGPNAAGKSTFFKALAGLLPVDSGAITLGATNLLKAKQQEWFKQVCYLPQMNGNTANLTVFETILLARKSNFSWTVNDNDIAAVSKLVSDFKLEGIAHKNISQLSGGQQQLTSICQALIRKPQLYLLDEPTSALDINRELQVLHALKRETYARNIITIVSLHNLTLAAKFADQLIVIDNGRINAQGSTEEVLKCGVIESTYDVEIEILRSKSGEPVITSNYTRVA